MMNECCLCHACLRFIWLSATRDGDEQFWHVLRQNQQLELRVQIASVYVEPPMGVVCIEDHHGVIKVCVCVCV